MQVKIHKNAKTTPSIRTEIQQSYLSSYAIAKKYNISWSTAKKWKYSGSIEDKSSRPHVLQTDLTQAQIDLILFERKQYKKTIEDIYFTLSSEIPNLYPMKIYRVLKRYAMSRLPDEFLDAERKIKKFRNYGIGYIHIDLLYAPKINKKRAYVYTAIDRVSKVAYIMMGTDKRKDTGAKFSRKVIEYYPYKINYILTDNGFEFSYKALTQRKKTKKIHPFDKICINNKIQHRTIKFRHPWTNGMVERFNRTIREKVLDRQMFSSIFEMEGKLIEFVNMYNLEKRLKSLNYKTPALNLKENNNIILQPIVN